MKDFYVHNPPILTDKMNQIEQKSLSKRYFFFHTSTLHFFIYLMILQRISADDGPIMKYSKQYCSIYLCPRYHSELTSYLNAGCEGDFVDYISSSTTSASSRDGKLKHSHTSTNNKYESNVSSSAIVNVSLLSFVVALIIGVLIGKNYDVSICP
jgi:hypothetical protein